VKTRARLALLILLAAVSAGATMPAGASALVSNYNCVLKPVGQWCDGQANGSYDGLSSWDYSEGWYPGAWDNTVTACEHVWRPATGNELGGGGWCAYNWIGHDYGDVQCNCYQAEVLQYSGGAHSINGYADSSY